MHFLTKKRINSPVASKDTIIYRDDPENVVSI
jgi:hypothetical protein